MKKQRKTTVFLLLGRVTRWKGHELFINAALRMPECEFWIGGLPNNRDAQWYEKIKKSSPSNVKWLGFVDPYETMKQVDALVSCSLGPEPFGRTLIEALATGIEVIAPDEGGPQKILEDYGMLYKVVEAFKPALTYKHGKSIDKELSRRANNRTNSLVKTLKEFVDNNSIKSPSRHYLEKYDLEIVCRATWNVILE